MEWKKLVKAFGQAFFLYGLLGFFIRFLTCDLMANQRIDHWHNVVSRWLPIPNDLFAVICIAVSFTGFVVWRSLA